MTAAVRFQVLSDRGDQRGASFTLPTASLRLLAGLRDVHLASVLPGATRGNHYHPVRHELLVVWAQDRWLFAWDQGEGTTAQRREFVGAGVVLICVDPLASHALHNSGTLPLHMVALSDVEYDHSQPDVAPRQVFP